MTTNTLIDSFGFHEEEKEKEQNTSPSSCAEVPSISDNPIFPKIKHIVLSGGGGTGFAYYGALRESHKDGFWNINEIETMHGVSCGSLFILVMAMLKHISWDDYDDYLIKRPWETVCGFSPDKLLNAYSNVGICGRETVEIMIAPILRAGDISLNITLQELYNFTNIDLHFYTTNLDTYKLVDLSYKTHPDWTVVDAIYCSCALPLLFRPNRINGEVYVDGGFLCNYPLQQCINQIENPDEIFGLNKTVHNKTKMNTETELASFSTISTEAQSFQYFTSGNETNDLLEPHKCNTVSEGSKEKQLPSTYSPTRRGSNRSSTNEPLNPSRTEEYKNITDYLLDIIAKTVKKLVIEPTPTKYTMDIYDTKTSVWELYEVLKTKETRAAKIQYGVQKWQEYKTTFQWKQSTSKNASHQKDGTDQTNCI